MHPLEKEETKVMTFGYIRVSSRDQNGDRQLDALQVFVSEENILGKKFQHLTVIEYAGKKNGMHRWKCRCDCGNEIIVGQTPLQSGKTKSCGCTQHNGNRDISANLFYKGFIEGTNIGKLEARMNSRPIASNKSGYNGVYRNSGGLWSAQITFRGRTYYLGSYEDIQDAVKARRKGEEMYEEFLNWYYNEFLPEREKNRKEEKSAE